MTVRFSLFRPQFFAVAAAAFVGICASQVTDPNVVLQQADRFADAGNGSAARPLYFQAEQAFAAQSDATKMMYARFGRLRRDLETGSYSHWLGVVNRELTHPAVIADPALRIRGLAVRAVIYMNLNSSEARRDWEEVARLAGEIGDKRWANRASGQLGLLAGVEGDYATALSKLLPAIETADKLGDLGAAVYFRTLFANGLAVLDRAAQAMSLYDRAIESMRTNPESGFPLLPTIGKVRALTSLNRFEEAQKLIAPALEYARANAVLGAQTELLVQSGLIAQGRADLRSAEKGFQEAADIARAATLPRMFASAKAGLADVYSAQREWTRAEHAIDEALDALDRAEEIYDLPKFLARKADLAAALGRTAEADRIYERATRIVESMLVNSASSVSKTSLIGSMSRVYTGHFRLTVERFRNTSRAFAIVERARGRSLADSMRYGERRNRQLTTWDMNIAAIQKRIRASRSPRQLNLLLRQLDQAEEKLAGVESARNRKVMREMALLNRTPVSLGTLQSRLRNDEAVLEYVLDEPQSYCLEITAKHATVHRLDGGKRIEAAIEKYLDDLRNRRASEDTGRYLYDALIGRTRAGAYETLVIVPDGKLHMLPFGALIRPDSRYLIEASTPYDVPSGTVLNVLRDPHRTRRGERSFLGIAYSDPKQAAKSSERSRLRGLFEGSGASFPPLAFAKEEIATAAQIGGGGATVLVGHDASEAALKGQTLSEFRVIHFAAHAVESKRLPERAGLVLYPGNDHEDGLWQPREIRKEHLNADLVVLSACESASGKIEGQEGSANLARTFLFAGAKSVIASTWQVDDRATATLMARFYSHMASGARIADALRRAQIDMLKQFGRDHPPFLWAGFLVIGDGARTVRFNSADPKAGTTRRSLRTRLP